MGVEIKDKSTYQTEDKTIGELSRSEETKQRILLAASAVFAQKGFDGSRVDEIAEAAHINKRMLYHHFDSKENLYLEVLRHTYNKLSTIGAWAIQPKSDPETAIKRAVREYFYFLACHDEFVRLINWESLNTVNYDNRSRPQLLDIAEPRLREVLQEGQRIGLLRRNLDIRHLLVSINALCLAYFSRREMLQIFWQEDLMSPALLEERLTHIMDFILNGILKHGEE